MSVFLIFLLSAVLYSCSAPRASMGTQTGREIYGALHKKQTLAHHNYGLYIIDAETGKEVYKYNAHDYFTPASLTKLFTFYIAREILPDRMPFVDYVIVRDTAILWPYGDPEFINPHLPSTAVSLVDSLENLADVLYLSNSQFMDKRFGKGWAWDDAMYAFQTEKNFFPAYGNLISFTLIDPHTHKIQVYPTYFLNWLSYRPEIEAESFTVQRAPLANAYDYNLGPHASAHEIVTIPMTTDKYSWGRMLNDTLDVPIFIKDIPYGKYPDKYTIYGRSLDSILTYMLHKSDNFIAEQVLLASAYTISDTLKTDIAINYAVDNLLTFLPDSIRYIDGSGLSRYNLNTPANVVKLLQLLYHKDYEAMKHYLPEGGGKNASTIQEMFKDAPYRIYAKSGSMRNTYNLAGYLITKNGKPLIFCWMNNHVSIPIAELKTRMKNTLELIYETY